MMMHIFENNLEQPMIAINGAPEALFEVSDMTTENKIEVTKIMHELT